MYVTQPKLRLVLGLLALSMPLVAAPLIQTTLRLVRPVIVALTVCRPLNHCVLNVSWVILRVQKAALGEPLLLTSLCACLA